MSNASYLLARVINHTFVQIRKIATSNHVIVPHYLGTENIYMDTYQKKKGRKKKKGHNISPAITSSSPLWDHLDISILSDILNYLHFCADMERLDRLESLGQQIPS